MRPPAVAALVAAGVLAITLAVAEFVAVRVASDAVGSAIGECLAAESVEISSIGRPAVVGIARGQLHDLTAVVRGAHVAELRIDRLEVRVDQIVDLRSAPQVVGDVAVVAQVADDDATIALQQRVPGILRPTVRFDSNRVYLSDERVPFDLELSIALGADELRVTPGAGDVRLWQVLGLEMGFALPANVELDDLRLAHHTATVTGRFIPAPDGATTGPCW